MLSSMFSMRLRDSSSRAEVEEEDRSHPRFLGQDPSFPVEIADLCAWIYGTGGGGSYTGQMMNDHDVATYNMHGIRQRLLDWTKSEDYDTENYEDYDEAQDDGM
nr:protein exordium-like 3 [Tanacetum cinerariifolium]